MKKEASLVLPAPDGACSLYLLFRKNNLILMSSRLLFCTTMMLIISNFYCTYSTSECMCSSEWVGGITVVAELNKVTSEGKKAFL